MIGEAIYIRVSDRKYNPIATKRGNVLTQSWRSKSAVFRMYHPLTLNGYSNFINAVKRQRNLGLISKQMTDFIAWPSIPSIPQSHVYCNESVEPLGASTHQTNGKAQYIAFWS